MCTFWLVEALVRAGAYDKKYLVQAISLFENMLGYANHLHMFSEEIARSGEQLGNTPQAFSHLALIRFVQLSVTLLLLTIVALLSTWIEFLLAVMVHKGILQPKPLDAYSTRISHFPSGI